MTHSSVLSHIVRNEDGTSSGVWGPFTLQSAFQPIFAFRDGKLPIAAFEGLTRPFRNGDPVSPATFFAALPAIDRLSVETLTRTLHLLNAAAFLPKETAIFINFDPSLFVDKSIIQAAITDIRQTLNSAKIDPQRVVCEVTEQKSTSAEALSDFVHVLMANGFKIAVDDYGAADSDIERIKSLRPEIVKFDAHWILRLLDSGPGFGLLKVMVEIFASQGIVTVFEGIQEDWQLDLAEKSGASMVQGFVLAKPELAPTSFATFPTTRLQLTREPNARVHEDRFEPVATYNSSRPFGRKVAQ